MTVREANPWDMDLWLGFTSVDPDSLVALLCRDSLDPCEGSVFTGTAAGDSVSLSGNADMYGGGWNFSGTIDGDAMTFGIYSGGAGSGNDECAGTLTRAD